MQNDQSQNHQTRNDQATSASQAEEDSAELIPAAMLNALSYCPRLFYLEYVQGEWEDSAETIAGRRVHQRVDARSEPLPEPAELSEAPRVARSVTVSSVADGITARADLVEAEGGLVFPVEYKRGQAPDAERVPGGVWPAERVQLGAQILALRDSGYACEGGAIYYVGSRRRVEVPLTAALAEEVRATVAEARRLQLAKTPPPPLADSPKCVRCAMVGICLPDEVRAEMDAQESADPETPEPSSPRAVLRRLHPPQQDGQPLYVQTQGAQVGRTGELLEIRSPDGEKRTVPLRQVSQVCLLGSVQLTAAAAQELCRREIDVSLMSFGGYHYGSLSGFSGMGVQLRLAQFERAREEQSRLSVVRPIIAGKILNGRTLLRRNVASEDREAMDSTLRVLKQRALDAEQAESEAQLLGLEGDAARLYFGALAGLFRPRSGPQTEFDFRGRNRRPPRDPVNALLSFGYALLLKDVRIALSGVGFDPMVGFFHRPRAGRPALALDLMEEFRPLIADSVVLSVINTEEVTADDFVRAAGAVALQDRGRRAFLAAYERRMTQEVTHPRYGYQLSYRRVLAVQARLLARTVQGELATYPSFRTR